MKVPSRRNVFSSLWGLISIVVVGLAGCSSWDRHDLATMLNIAEIPISARDVECVAFGFTDIEMRCALTIAPGDFDALLAGYYFSEVKSEFPGADRSQTSHTYCCGPKVGPDFSISHVFTAFPGEFKDGGRVAVLADQGRSFVMVDSYIE